MGALAESFGLRDGLKYRKPVKEELETVLRLDPAFMDGSADRVLGRWYFRGARACSAAATSAQRNTCARRSSTTRRAPSVTSSSPNC